MSARQFDDGGGTNMNARPRTRIRRKPVKKRQRDVIFNNRPPHLPRSAFAMPWKQSSGCQPDDLMEGNVEETRLVQTVSALRQPRAVPAQDIDKLAEQLASLTLLQTKSLYNKRYLRTTTADLTGVWMLQNGRVGVEYTKSIFQPECNTKTASPLPPLKVFTCFCRLPVEIRLLVWKHARPEPRFVSLAWSQTPRVFPSCYKDGKLPKYYDEYDYRFAWSPARIPAMLHTCIESRQVALEWYKLSFPATSGQPRTYFDADTDYVKFGCEACDDRSFCCDACTRLVGWRDKVKKILFRWNSKQATPFFSLYLYFRSIKEILLFDPSTAPFKQDVTFTHVAESEKEYAWHQGKSLYQCYLEEKPDLDNRYAAELTDKDWPDGLVRDKGPFRPERISRVEIAINPETSNLYGFVKEKFQSSSFDFKFSPMQN